MAGTVHPGPLFSSMTGFLPSMQYIFPFPSSLDNPSPAQSKLTYHKSQLTIGNLAKPQLGIFEISHPVRVNVGEIFV